jgi:hypothetical protein
MGLDKLRNLVDIGQLKTEPFSRAEFLGLMESGAAKLRDAAREELSPDSRFDLAYNAAHALALAALRLQGYRSTSRYLVFQSLTHTLNLSNDLWRILDLAHRKRNLAEYEGHLDLDAHLISGVIRAAREILGKLEVLATELPPE